MALGDSHHPLGMSSVTIKGHTYRTTVAVMGGEFMIPLSAENRKSSGVAAGDEVDVGIELDTGPREVTVPPDFKGALDRDTNAKRSFESSPTATSCSMSCRSRKPRKPKLGSDA